MRDYFSVFMALVILSRVKAQTPFSGSCVGEECFTVFTDVSSFSEAQKVCQKYLGNLMTVRTTVSNDAVSLLLNGLSGNYWIGLQCTVQQCSVDSHDLKGYAWITGDRTTDFKNWKNNVSVSSPSCVSVSNDDLMWTERQCNEKIDGYLCETKQNDMCNQLQSNASVMYQTPLGFQGKDLIVVPQGTIGINEQSGTKHLCAQSKWRQAPWNCEVYLGGCEFRCVQIPGNHKFQCTCQRGFTLDDNNVSCSRAGDDPCLQAGCTQECVPREDTFLCLCHNGYELQEDQRTCIDIDECADERLCTLEKQECINTPGGFECRCRSGYSETGGTCSDIDECWQEGLQCEHECINTEGSFHCQCFQGFKTDETDKYKCQIHCSQTECQAIDCDPNNPYQCHCPIGYILDERSDGRFCVDINECDMFYCHHSCENTFGGYVCSCDIGFELIEGNDCRRIVRPTEGGVTTAHGILISTVSPTPEVTTMSAGGLLGIIVVIVVMVLLIVCLSHHFLKYCGKFNLTEHKNHGADIHDFQQMTLGKYSMKSYTSGRQMTQEA